MESEENVHSTLVETSLSELAIILLFIVIVVYAYLLTNHLASLTEDGRRQMEASAGTDSCVFEHHPEIIDEQATGKAVFEMHVRPDAALLKPTVWDKNEAARMKSIFERDIRRDPRIGKPLSHGKFEALLDDLYEGGEREGCYMLVILCLVGSEKASPSITEFGSLLQVSEDYLNRVYFANYLFWKAALSLAFENIGKLGSETKGAGLQQELDDLTDWNRQGAKRCNIVTADN